MSCLWPGMPINDSLDGKNFLKNAKFLVKAPFRIVKTAGFFGPFPHTRFTEFSLFLTGNLPVLLSTFAVHAL